MIGGVLNRRKALVLNRGWAAVGIVSMQRAITLLASEHEDGKPKARIITPPPVGSFELFDWSDWTKLRPEEGEDAIITSHDLLKVPDVILLTRYDRVPDQKVHFCRKAVWKRDNYTCQYCGCKPPPDELTLDHIIPRAQGGETSWTNCVLACYQCNAQKADRRPEDAYRPKDKDKAAAWRGPNPMKLRSKPVKPKFSLFRGDPVRIPETWKHWLDKMYWEVPLENDMNEISSDTVDDFDM